MSRKKCKISKFRKLEPDIKYGSILITKLINNVMKEGKKTIAMKIVYGALEDASKRLKLSPKEVIEKAIGNVRPQVEVRSRRIGGATYQIPLPVSEKRGVRLAIGWILDAARSRKGAPMAKKLADELVNAVRNEGAAIKVRDNVHKMAEANRAFAHYRY
ncbi:MAG: 30S ribosomal protein S7 [Elusimicrobia bacterium]|nr:30S ribosomal protein S7 [Elusimicrobiota bacterium]